MNLALQITLQTPPANTSFSLQKGQGSKFALVQIQRYTSDDLLFNFAIEVKGERQKDTLPDFKGAFVQGPKGGRFVYIVIGGLTTGYAELINGRIKIPLTGITWDTINKAAANAEPTLETSVPGTGKKGGPNYATVKPFDGWTVKPA